MAEENKDFKIDTKSHIIINRDMKPSSYGKLPISDIYTLKLSHYKFVLINNVRSNCKAWSIDNISEALSFSSSEALYKISAFMNSRAGALIFTVNVTHLKYIKILSEKFKLIGMSEVPVGYNKGFQYHAVFLTNNSEYSNYAYYKARCEEEVRLPESFGNNKISIEEFEKNFTKDVIQKCIDYMYIGWAKRFFKKILT